MADISLSQTGGDALESEATAGFHVELDSYQGPFDVLLGLLANKRLELTEVSLATVTEEFIAYINAMDLTANMDEASGFIDVASVLVEAKSAALLPSFDDGERDEHSMDALRERDLLFARLLQYKAFKQAGVDFRTRMAANAGRVDHPGYVDDAIAAMMPKLQLTVDAESLARLAARALAGAPPEEVSVSQLHVPLVDLREQASMVRDRLRMLPAGDSMTFDQLTADTDTRIEVVARFLAVLAFFKQGDLQFKQEGPYADLHLRWAAGLRSTADSVKGGDAGSDSDDGDVMISEKDFA
ncbi:segregation and condensation protein A [Bifidobacterium callimiconis]|uniref:segregation and condensation protein A n=1 Tax=Bifidobacterium callimiconis TaxID=2306973 RepID=UPI000F7D94E6|nr:segregation/condensation protein A [Bifidobacterium callimiconis]MBT1176775.1 segregation/condensation protein A [Bifidobacterium callimiconis]